MTREALELEAKFEDKFSAGVKAASENTERLDRGLKNLSQGAFGVSTAFDVVKGKTREVAGAEDLLIKLGIQTTRSVQDKVAAINLLIDKYEADVVATRQLVAAREQLLDSTVRVTSETRHAEQAMFGLGFIIQDSSQFANGFGLGMRAIANNLQPVIQSIGRAEGGFKGMLRTLKGSAGLILAVNALTTAMVILPQFLGENAKALEEQKKAIDKVIESFIRVKQIGNPFAEILPERIKQVNDALKEQLDIIAKSNAIRTQGGIRPSTVIGGLGAAVPPAITREQLQTELESVEVRERLGEKTEDLAIEQDVLNKLIKKYNEELAEAKVREKARTDLIKAGLDVESLRAEMFQQIIENNTKLKIQLDALNKQGDKGFLGGLAKDNILLQEAIDTILGLNSQLWAAETAARALARAFNELSGAGGKQVLALENQNEALTQQIANLRLRGQLEDDDFIKQAAALQNENTHLEKRLTLQLALNAAERPKKIKKEDQADPLARFGPSQQDLDKLRATLLQAQLDVQGIIGGAFDEAIDLTLQAERAKKFADLVREAASDVRDSLQGIGGAVEESHLRQLFEENFKGSAEAVDVLDRKLRESTDRIRSNMNQLANAIETGFENSVESFAAGIGLMIAAEKNAPNLGQTLLGGLADLAINVGKIAIANGIVIEAIAESLRSFTGIPAIVAGAALIAVGTAVKSQLKGAIQRGGQSTAPAPIAIGNFNNSLGSRFDAPRAPSRNPQPGTQGSVVSPSIALGAAGTLNVAVSGRIESRRGVLSAEIRQEARRDERTRVRF